MQRNSYSDVYDGNEPYLFISYSHKDDSALNAVKTVLKENNVRYWYDNGLHSGDDWNLVIAKRLMGAAVCLLLLSPNSADSDYVKNELSFALNHRISVHTLLIKKFVLPLDIEMMTGRIQMVEMTAGYQEKLIRSLPREVFKDSPDTSGRCPKCGSERVRLSDEKSEHGWLWMLVFGWAYLLLTLIKWVIGVLIFLYYDWWMALVKACMKKRHTWKCRQWFSGKKRVFCCSDCGYKFKEE